MGPRVGRAALARRRRRAREQDERDHRRRVAAHDHRRRRVHPRPLLRTGPAPTQARRASVRRGSPEAAARRSRLPQGVRGVPRRGPPHRRAFRDRLELPITDQQLMEDPPYYHPGRDSDEFRYMVERRRALGGVTPRRVMRAKPLGAPADTAFAEFAKGSGKAAASTTMAFTRLMRNLLRDQTLGKRVVPIIPDEARTFGMDPLFKEVGIYSSLGQRYEPVDAETLLPYREATNGQVLEEGITEAGSMASFTAAGTSYATHSEAMLPFYIFY